MKDGHLVQLAKVLEQLPVYTLEFVVQTIIAILSDFTVTSLAVGSVFVGLMFGIWPALAAFFFILVACRVVNSVANAIGVSGQNVSASLRQLSPSAMMPMATMPVSSPINPTERINVVASSNEVHD